MRMRLKLIVNVRLKMIVSCGHLFNETFEFLFFSSAFFFFLHNAQLSLYFEFDYLFANFLPYIAWVVILLLQLLSKVASLLYIHFFERFLQQINKLSHYIVFLLKFYIKIIFFCEKFTYSTQTVIMEIQESDLAADVDGFSVVIERFSFKTHYFLDLYHEVYVYYVDLVKAYFCLFVFEEEEFDTVSTDLCVLRS